MEEKPLNLRSGYYRVSVKALIFDESRTRFLLVQEDNGKWELPGGGLEWGETSRDGLIREIKEEMGLTVLSVADTPSYLTTMQRDSDGLWVANIMFETTVENLDFVPSDVCVAVRFVNCAEARALPLFGGTQAFLQVFNPSNHS